MSEEKKCLRVCATCPWLKENHNKEHPAGWYKIENLKRLWNGLRKGDAPGIVCHSTDPKNIEYGGDKEITPGHESPCAGAMILMINHVNEASKTDMKEYKSRHSLPLTKGGIAVMIEKALSGQLPPVEDKSSEVGLPWDKKD